MTTMMVMAALGGYLLGSIPFGLVFTRMVGMGDIRDIGSGNIGATNVLRTGNKPLALATLLCDSGKGGAAVLIAGTYFVSFEASLFAGAGAVVGHNFPVWLRFKGGKGVATALGTLLIAIWPVGVAACITWLATALVFRFSSLASILALGASPIFAWFLLPSPGNFHATILAAGLAVLVVARHYTNIARLINGEESKIGTSKSEHEYPHEN